MTLKQQKAAIRAFLHTEIWTDEKLCQLLAHAQDKLSMWSCCCLIGLPNANHALRPCLLSEGDYGTELAGMGEHYEPSLLNPLADPAEFAFYLLGNPDSIEDDEDNAMHWCCDHLDSDELRRSRIRPIIRAELRRRERERAAQLARGIREAVTA